MAETRGCDIAAMRDKVDKLAQLLHSPEPGLGTWHGHVLEDLLWLAKLAQPGYDDLLEACEKIFEDLDSGYIAQDSHLASVRRLHHENRIRAAIAAAKPETPIVAAADSTPASKAAADHVCDGVADEIQIEAALDTLPDTDDREIAAIAAAKSEEK